MRMSDCSSDVFSSDLISWDFPWFSRCLSLLALPLGECQFVSDLGSSRAPIQGFSQGIYSDRARGRRMPYRAGSGHSLAGVPLSAQAGMMAPFTAMTRAARLWPARGPPGERDPQGGERGRGMGEPTSGTQEPMANGVAGILLEKKQ